VGKEMLSPRMHLSLAQRFSSENANVVKAGAIGLKKRMKFLNLKKRFLNDILEKKKKHFGVFSYSQITK
jgi:hypothetical protein